MSWFLGLDLCLGVTFGCGLRSGVTIKVKDLKGVRPRKVLTE